MVKIRVKGSITPAVGELARDEVADVEYTDHVQRLIDRGHFVAVDELPEGDDGAHFGDRGQSDAERVAAEGATEDSALHAEDSAADPAGPDSGSGPQTDPAE